MSSPTPFLEGNELVLIAEVPKAGGRWHQVHMNREVMHRFFRLDPGVDAEAAFEQVDAEGRYRGTRTRRLVYSASSNKNPKIEFDLPNVDYPSGEERPILLALEVDVRRFRYLFLMPGDPGYSEMLDLNRSLPPVGTHPMRRVLSTLDEVEMRWPECPLRDPHMGQA
jgi:hypothetical protein